MSKSKLAFGEPRRRDGHGEIVQALPLARLRIIPFGGCEPLAAGEASDDIDLAAVGCARVREARTAHGRDEVPRLTDWIVALDGCGRAPIRRLATCSKKLTS